MGALKSKILRKFIRNRDELFFVDIQNQMNLTNCTKDYETVTYLTITHSTLVPESVGRFRNLTHLDLSNNGMELVPWFIVYLKQLEVLNLSHNQLNQLPPTMFYFNKLKSLDLSYNLIEHLPTNLLMYKSLKTINVEGNVSLVSPPLDVCLQGKCAIFEELKRRQTRTNLWADWKPFYSGTFIRMKALVELCMDTILNSDIDYLAVGTIPPTVKRYISSAKGYQSTTSIRLMKCSNCGGNFSKRHFFDNHICSVLKYDSIVPSLKPKLAISRQ